MCICETDEDCVKNMDGRCHCRLSDALQNKDLPNIDSYLAECSARGIIIDTSWSVYHCLQIDDERFINTINMLNKYESSIEEIDRVIQNLKDRLYNLDCCKHREWNCELEYEIEEEIESLRLTQKDYSEIKDIYNWNVYITFKKYKMEYVF